MIYTFLCTFAFGLRQLFPRHIRKRKKRHAYLEVGNVGNSRLFRGKSVIGFSRYSVGCYYHTLNKGYSYDLRLRTWHLQFHASWFNKIALRTAEFIKINDEQIWIP